MMTAVRVLIACLAAMLAAACAPGWKWDRVDSAPQPSASSARIADDGPSPRAFAAMAYDDAGKRIVLFGGQDSSGRRDDTWSWDGTRWTELSAPGPSAREGAAMAYDPIVDALVLVGGSDTVRS